MTQHKIYQMSFASVYPHYVAKIQKKGKTVAELDEIIKWLTGYTADGCASSTVQKTGSSKTTLQRKAARPAFGRSAVILRRSKTETLLLAAT